MKSCRRAGYEKIGYKDKGKKNTAGNTFKLEESLSRTKSKIYELAICNQWEYFVTLTLSPDGHDRQDLKAFKKQLASWLNNLNSRKKTNIKYLLIPEPHKDGSWHMHGLFSGIPQEWLVEFTLQDKLPYKVLNLLREGRKIYNWPAYAKKFGYVTCERILDKERCAKYIMKYITKEICNRSIELNFHMFYPSQGLKRAKTLIKGHLSQSFAPDFFNDYVATKLFDSYDEAIQHFIDSNEESEPVTFSGLIENLQRRCDHWTPCLQT